MCGKRQREGGASLIEMTIFIVIIGIAIVPMLNVFALSAKESVDPWLRKQSIAVAESLIEEIQAKEFANPAGGWTGAANSANRRLFDDIGDYHGLSLSGISDLNGTAILGLEAYGASVVVESVALGSVSSTDARRITVTVVDPRGDQVVLAAFRADY